MTRLILIRHGETDYNLQREYCGFSDPPLNKKGILQAEKLANRLRGIKIDKIYSSDSKRTRETANIIFIDNSIEALEDFREMNFGIFEGLKYEEIIKKYPSHYRQWIDNPKGVRISMGEDLMSLNKRVKEKLYFLLSRHRNKTIAVVTHSGPIRIILCEALKYDLKMFWQMEQDIGALNIIDYPLSLPPIIVGINDTSHFPTQEAVSL